jgi:hypothetical protein
MGLCRSPGRHWTPSRLGGRDDVGGRGDGYKICAADVVGGFVTRCMDPGSGAGVTTRVGSVVLGDETRRV